MPTVTHAKFHFNQLLMATLIFGTKACEPPPGSDERLKRTGLIGLKAIRYVVKSSQNVTLFKSIYTTSEKMYQFSSLILKH